MRSGYLHSASRSVAHLPKLKFSFEYLIAWAPVSQVGPVLKASAAFSRQVPLL